MDLIEKSWAILDEIRSRDEKSYDTFNSEWTCETCGGDKVLVETLVCTSCGLSDDYFISEEPEWNSGPDPDSGNKDPSRVGAPINMDHFSVSWGMGTMIVPRKKSYADARMSRIHHHTSMHHRDRSLFHAYNQMMEIGITLGLPDVVMYSAKIKYKEFSESKLTRGAVRNGIKANCIFQACREHNISRSSREISEAFGIPIRDLSRTSEIFNEEMTDAVETQNITASNLVPRFFNQIQLPDSEKGKIKMKVIKICKNLDDSVELMGRTPKAIACAVILFVLEDKIDKNVLCKICDVSLPTLTKIFTIVKAELKDSKRM